MNRRTFIRNSAVAGAAIATGIATAQGAARFTCIMFTKHLKGQSIDEMIASMKFVGSGGMDLAVRPGYPVDPDNCAGALVPAVEKIRAAAISPRSRVHTREPSSRPVAKRRFLLSSSGIGARRRKTTGAL